MGLFRGSSTYYTIFSGKGVRIRLEIRATRRFVGHYVLTFERRSAKDGENGLAKERDVL